MFRNLELTAELFRIYLFDDSEKANIAAINAITRAFNVTAGALFYVNAKNVYRFSLAGSLFPIELPENRWRDCIENNTSKSEVKEFGRWAPPGIDIPVEYWVSAPLYANGTGNGYVFLGKDIKPWTEAEIKAFISVTSIIAEIVAIRYKKEAEAYSRSQAEAALSANVRRMTEFFDSSRDMIYTTDPEGHFTSINAAGLKLIGRSDPKEVIGRTFSDFAQNSDVHDYFMQRIKQDGYVADLEIVLKNSDGTPCFCLETSHAIKNEDGSITEIQGLIKDITERIKNERELWKMNMELAELNMQLQQTRDLMLQQEKLASIGQLAAGIAHEINNPLGFLTSNQNMIKTYFGTVRTVCRTLRDSGNPLFEELNKANDLAYVFPEMDQILKENDEGYVRIKKIVANLMSFSRMDRNVDFELYDVNAGIESTLIVAWNEIKYVAEVQKDFNEIPKIYAHGGEINQVVLNILVNAAQAIAGQKRAEKGKIMIQTRLEGASVVVLISDDGPGIPHEIISRIFDPFFTTKETGKGTGLGLSISYDIIVSKHNGLLSVVSEPGEGTTFRIELPISHDKS